MSDELFQPASSGYSPDRFYTTHGERSSESKEMKVRFDPVLLDQIFKLYIAPEDKFGDYRSISDFVADAVHHRHRYLLAEYGERVTDDPEVLRVTQVWERRAATKVVTDRLSMRMDTVEHLVRGMKLAGDHNQWADPDTLEQLMAEAEEILPSLSERQQSKIMAALRQAKRDLKSLRSDGQMQLSAEIRKLEDDDLWSIFEVGEPED